MTRKNDDTPKQADTYLKKGKRKVLVIGAGKASGYTKVLLPFTSDEASRARTNDRVGIYNAAEKTHAPRSNFVHQRVTGTILNVASANLMTEKRM